MRDNRIEVQFYSLNDYKWVFELSKKSGIKTVPQIWDREGNNIGGYSELKTLLKGE